MTARSRIKTQSSILDEVKARLLGFLAGDGGVYPDTGTARAYPGIDKDMAVICASMFKDVYGLDSSIRELKPGKARRKQTSYEVNCHAASMVEDLLKWGRFGIDDWRVPQAVMDGTSSIKGAWLSGWFEAEGSVFMTEKNKTRRVTAMTTNVPAMKQVVKLLASLGIDAGVTYRAANPKKNTQEAVQVNILNRRDIEKFAIWAGFLSPSKKAKLAEVVLSYETDKDPQFAALLAIRLAGEPVVDEEAVRLLLVARDEKRLPRKNDGKVEAFLPKIHALRLAGVKWKDVGRALGYEGSDQAVATRAIMCVQWAKKKGLWPLKTPPAPPTPRATMDLREETP